MIGLENCCPGNGTVGSIPTLSAKFQPIVYRSSCRLYLKSLKFTPKGDAIELSARKQETQVEISVIDNGPGISKQTQARSFEKFSQLKMNDRRGLGLFIANWIIDAHKGHIWVTSNVGKGSTFSFTIPLRISH